MYVVNSVEVFGFTRSTCKKPLLSTCSVSNTEQFRACETFLFYGAFMMDTCSITIKFNLGRV